MQLRDELPRHPELKVRNHCYKAAFFFFLRRLNGGKSVVWLVAVSATTPWRHTQFWEAEASRVLGAEWIKLPRWPVSKFHKAFKVPVAFLLFRGAGECTRIENTVQHFTETFL